MSSAEAVPEVPFGKGDDNITNAIMDFDWRIMCLQIIALFRIPDVTIFGKSLKEAIAIFLCDTWPKVVPANTGRIAKWEPNGTNIDVDTPRPKDGDGELRFYAGEIAEFLDNPEMLTLLNEGLALLESGACITSEILTRTILKTPGCFSGFCFSVAKNASVFNVFIAWFGSLSKDQQTKLIDSPEWLKALCMHIVWIHANCGGKHTLDAVGFDAVVKAVGTHHEFPTLDIIISLIGSDSDADIAKISTYAASYVDVWRTRSDATAIYTDMDSTKFQQFAKIATASSDAQ